MLEIDFAADYYSCLVSGPKAAFNFAYRLEPPLQGTLGPPPSDPVNTYRQQVTTLRPCNDSSLECQDSDSLA